MYCVRFTVAAKTPHKLPTVLKALKAIEMHVINEVVVPPVAWQTFSVAPGSHILWQQMCHCRPPGARANNGSNSVVETLLNWFSMPCCTSTAVVADYSAARHGTPAHESFDYWIVAAK